MGGEAFGPVRQILLPPDPRNQAITGRDGAIGDNAEIIAPRLSGPTCIGCQIDIDP
ncbi:hypothetical protein [Komagataeibacter kakiaceti]|nr:hypothetical protein [Komagataeibacter kakiaceti]